MARVTVEDCLDNVENLFQLVLVASKRARQLSHGAEATVSLDRDKPTVVALREIAEGDIGPAILSEPDRPPRIEAEFDAPNTDSATEEASASKEESGPVH